MSAERPAGGPKYDERLWAPWTLLAVATTLTATLGLAFGYPLGLPVGLGTFVLVEALVLWVLFRASGRVSVGEGLLTAGRASLPLSAVGRVTCLDREAAALLRGRGADARAYLFLRPWAPLAVRVDVDDPEDPTPYWYLSTRHPDELAAAISAPH